MKQPVSVFLLTCLLLVGLITGAAAQCTYTTTRDGNLFNDPGVFAVTGGTNCAANPTTASSIIINHRITLNGNLTIGNNGSLTINATGALLEDAISRTLAIDGGALTIAAVTSRSVPRLRVSVLSIARTGTGNSTPSVTIGANSAVQVTCLALGNQGGLTLNSNSLLNVSGNVDVSNGNGTIIGAASGSAPAGIRVFGVFTGVNGGTSNVYGAAGLVTCVQGNTNAATCPSSGSVQNAPANNDPSCINVLPVSLTTFSAKRQAREVSVRWATASEIRNAYFEVQRSLDGQTFMALGKIAGNGTTATGATYSFLDRTPLTGLAYYRLRQVDTDGTEHFSAVAVVAAEQLEAAFYPNPSNHNITLPAAEVPVRYCVYSTLGQRVAAGTAPGGSTVNLQHVPAGTYLLELSSAGQRNVQRFVRQ